MKVLRRLKTIIPAIAGVACAVLALICTGHVKVYAADNTNGNSQVTISNTQGMLITQNLSNYASVDGYEAEYTDADHTTYAFGAPCSTDFYITYSFCLSNQEQVGKYVSGTVFCNDTISVTTGATTGYTIQNTRYTLSLVNCDSCANIVLYQNGNEFRFYGTYKDILVDKLYQGFSFTVLVHATCMVLGSSLTAWRTLKPPLVTVSHSLSNFSTTLHSGLEVDDSTLAENVDGIWLKLVELNNRNAYTDSLGTTYSSAELMYLVYGAQSSGNGKLDNIRNYLTTMHETDVSTNIIVGNLVSPINSIKANTDLIKYYLASEGSDTAHTARDNINQAHLTEQGAQSQATSILNGLNSGSVNFDTGISSISNIPVSNLVSENAQSINFWKTVTGQLMDPSILGPCATILCILVILALTVWLLKL